MSDSGVKPIDSLGLRGAAKEAWDAQARLRQVLLRVEATHPNASADKTAGSSIAQRPTPAKKK
jgi:hypothetical protein